MLLELHAHSHHSTGEKITSEALASPAEVVRRAKETGLSGIAITDHDTIRSWEEAAAEARKQGILFIPAVEITTASGHVTGLGLSEGIEKGLPLEETLDRIREQGGISIAVHPFDVRNKGVKHEMHKADAIEVFSALNLDRVTNWYCAREARNYPGKPKVAGSDAHCLDMVGMAPTLVASSDDMDSVLRHIRQGKVRPVRKYIPVSVMVKWAKDRMTTSYMDVISYVNHNYPGPKAWAAKKLLRSFVFSRRMKPWMGLAYFGLGMSVVYSAFRALTL